MLKEKEFKESDLVWKIVLPIGDKDPSFGKWSSNWEGLLIVNRAIIEGAYRLLDMNG